MVHRALWSRAEKSHITARKIPDGGAAAELFMVALQNILINILFGKTLPDSFLDCYDKLLSYKIHGSYMAGGKGGSITTTYITAV